MSYFFLFILFSTLSVVTESDNNTDLYWKSLVYQGQYILRDNPNASIAPIPKLSSRSIPKEFDARKKWPKCKKMFDHMRNQGNCGSCWAEAAATMISQVHCIHTGGAIQFIYSAQDILSCAPHPEKNGCVGGELYDAIQYWIDKGCPSGGEHRSNYGCVPYSDIAFWNNNDGGCLRSCSNRKYSVPYKKDKKFGSAFKYEQLQNSMLSIQHSIMTYGPVVAAFTAYRDFTYLGRSSAVYCHKGGGNDEGFGHGVVLLGWGEEKGVPYWLGQNSWGKRWAANGYFKYLRGKNHCEMEQHVLRLLSKKREKEKKKITKKPPRKLWEKYYGRQYKGHSPKVHVISRAKRCNGLPLVLLVYSVFVLSKI